MANPTTYDEKGAWSKLLDTIACGILNWRSTLRGMLRLSVPVTGFIAMLHKNDPGNLHYATWIFCLTVGAEAVKSFLDIDSKQPSCDSSGQTGS